MKRLRACSLAFFAAGCVGPPPVRTPAPETSYRAAGTAPGWSLTINESMIMLRLERDNFTAGDDITAQVGLFPLTRSAAERDGRVWEGGAGTEAIRVEARPGRCTAADGTVYDHSVNVRLSGRELHGCGGATAGGTR